MNQRFLMWGLASITFVVTLAVTSWNDGIWQSEEPTATTARGMRAVSFAMSEESTDVPSHPFAPTHAPVPVPVQTVAAVTPSPAAPTPPGELPPPVEPSTQPTSQELDEQDFMAQRDRASEHSARSR